MKSKRLVLIIPLILSTLALSFVTLMLLAAPQSSSAAPQMTTKSYAPQAISVTFPTNSGPGYAQTTISVHPEPPQAQQPVELCAEVVNQDPTAAHEIMLEFSIANFGIGVPFQPVGQVQVVVPAGGTARGCINWVPPEPGHWCIQAAIHQGAEPPLISQRNIDIWEPLIPGQADQKIFEVGPFSEQTTISFTHKNLLPGWDAQIDPISMTLGANEPGQARLTVTPPSAAVVGSREIVVDVEGYVNGELVGGFRKLDTPPIPLHRLKDPFFAESEISIQPYPPRAGEPTEICVELRNLSDEPQTVEVTFNRAAFGLGLPFAPLQAPMVVTVPANGTQRVCINWIPPEAGHFCIQVELNILGPIPYHPQFSQRNLDVAEPLQPGVPHSIEFPVGNAQNDFLNPNPTTTDIWLETEIHLPGWEVALEPPVLAGMDPGEQRLVTMIVTPAMELPPDGTPIVDVVGMIDGPTGPTPIGGIRKVFRPPVPLHRLPDPPYAEGEISIFPYPPRAGEPTEVCVELYNPTNVTQTVKVQFGRANFGIGLPFHAIGGQREVEIPPNSTFKECIRWIPPMGGHVCLQVILEMEGYDPQISQRNIDIDEPLEPGVPHTLMFPVGNPLDHATDIEMAVIPHLQDWVFEVSPTLLLDMNPNEHRMVSLTVVPPAAQPLPDDAIVLADVEAFAEGQLIGGFRKIHRPPVPLHPFPDPPYAEREITIEPYPPRQGEPTEVCVELYNPTAMPQDVVVHFSWANFGIGIPFTAINGPRMVHLPPNSTVKECIYWVPPIDGHVCLQVELEMENYAPQFSQRNIDIDEPLEPLTPHSIWVPIGNPFDHPVTITFGLVPHLPNWTFEISPQVLPNMPPGHVEEVLFTVTPPERLPPDGTPIVDVEAYVMGELIGGFRKIFRPPIPLHRFPDPPYAEREISIHPYPPRAGEPTEVCVELHNPTNVTRTVQVQFGRANFGIGLPFYPISGQREVEIPPNSTIEECFLWVPPVGGHVCLQVKLEMEGYAPQISQRNIDIDEPLEPGVPHSLMFPVGNPSNQTADIEMGAIPHVPNWDFMVSPTMLLDVGPGEFRMVKLTVVPPAGMPLPDDATALVDVEAYIEGRLIGGFRKIHRPPVPLHPFPDPPYAEREITVEPYPPQIGEPTEICVELHNPTAEPQDVVVNFSWANFGIGIPFTAINGPRMVHLPAHSTVKECIHWVPPVSGHVCLQVELQIENYASQFSQRNIDVDEPLEPLTPHSRTFPVGNPFDHPVSITLGLVPHRPHWVLDLSRYELLDMAPGEIREVTLTVTPPEKLPPDGTPIVDVEAFVDGELIGGFRKIFRPPVPIHRPKDPIYAESEIFIHPYPPREREPTEVGVEIRNPTDAMKTVTVTFSASRFGIGLPFQPIHEPLVVEVPPKGRVRPQIMWIPPWGGLWCIQIALELPGHDEIYISRRNMDVGEPLEPNVPHARVFPVRNPYNQPVTITLGLVPHLADWDLALSEDELLNMAAHEVRPVTLTVKPPDELPPDGAPIVDVEAYVNGQLIGGFRKLFRPPVPIHRPKDPVYAESEIGIDPYPVIPGQPTKLSVEVFNPTDEDHIVTATFSIARFGIGLPFSTDNIINNPVRIFVPAHGAARGRVIWRAPDWLGKFCVRVTLEMENHEMVWSQRNIDVGEPLRPGEPHTLVFPVGGWPHDEPVSVTLGLINHQDGWEASLSQDMLYNVQPGQPVQVSLTVTPAMNAELGSNEPIVDVEAFVDGELIGGFRKIDRPPIPLHKPHEKGYAETEIVINPYPPKLGTDSRLSTEVQNTSDTTMTVNLEFGWAKFGMGIPFTTTGMQPYTRSVTVAPAMTATAWVTWTPTMAGHQCVQVWLQDAEGQYQRQRSQRNVDVRERPPCGMTREYTFTVYNDSPFSATVDIGMITFNVPAHWEITVVPSDTLTLEPFSEGSVQVFLTIPCPLNVQSALTWNEIYAIQAESDSLPTIDVEGYVDGEIVGGIELQFEEQTGPTTYPLYMPLILKTY